MPGYRVLTPLVRAGTRRLLLVDRGWVPLGPSRDDPAVGERCRCSARRLWSTRSCCPSPACGSARPASAAIPRGRGCSISHGRRISSRARRSGRMRASCCWIPTCRTATSAPGDPRSGSDPSVILVMRSSGSRLRVVLLVIFVALSLERAMPRTKRSPDLHECSPIRIRAAPRTAPVAAAGGVVLRAARRRILALLRSDGLAASGGTNQGDLIDPAVPLPRSRCSTPRASRSRRLLTGKWTMLYVGDGACDERCRRALYLSRQSRLALNKDMDRVQRVFLVTAQLL